MTVRALWSEGHHHLRTVAAQTAHDVALEAVLDRLDFLNAFQRSIRIVEDFQEGDPQLGGGVAKFDLPNVRQAAKVTGLPSVPEPGGAARHRHQADRRTLRAVARDGRGAPEAFVVRVRYHDHQALAVTTHSEQCRDR